MTALVGIDLGGTRLRVALADGRGRIRDVERRPTKAALGPDAVINRIAETVGGVLERNAVSRSAVRTIGIGVPGPVDPRSGTVFIAPNLAGWRNVRLNAILTKRTAIPTFLHHDAHLAALGEATRGAARGAQHLVYVTVSTGIGAGLMIDGRLYSGAGGVAGEVGHIVIDPGGPRCLCGNRGCLEAIASGTAIARQARAAVGRRVPTALRSVRTPGGPTARDVVRAARAGDAVATRILHDAGTALGIGLGTVVNLLGPELLLIGGSVTKAGPLLMRPMQASLQASSWESARRALRIKRPSLGQDVGLIGAVEWARLCAKDLDSSG